MRLTRRNEGVYDWDNALWRAKVGGWFGSQMAVIRITFSNMVWRKVRDAITRHQ